MALLSPGNLGAELAAHLVGRGVEVVSPLDGRSESTRALAQAAGIRSVGSLRDAIDDAAVVLSLVPPASALSVAREVGAEIVSAGARPLYVDANSISPRTAIEVAAIVTGAGARFVDASIIAPTPRSIATTRVYAAGPGLDEFLAFGSTRQLDVHPLGRSIGRASALKMAYSCLTKGLPAITVGLLVVAASAGLSDELLTELEISQPEVARDLPRSLSRTGRLAERWAGEADEIARTFEDVGLPAPLFEGVAEMYRRIASSVPRGTDPTPDQSSAASQLVASVVASLSR